MLAMQIRIVKYILLTMFFMVLVFSCKAADIGYRNMESSEKEFNRRQSEEMVSSMPLGTMFRDQQVRKLARAAEIGNIKKIEELVAEGADVNYQGTGGATPLFWALRNSSLEGFDKLLVLGADPNIIFADGSVIHWAARHKNTMFLQKALSHGGNPNLVAGSLDETPLFKTIGAKGSNNRAAMILLLERGANINAVTGGEHFFGMSLGGKTPVMVAADIIRFDLVYELLNLGADYNLKDDSGRSLIDRINAFNGRFSDGSAQKEHLKNVRVFLSQTKKARK
jgi:ankyrin repeat protein